MAVRNIQQKLFHGAASPNADVPSRSISDLSLTIDIPRSSPAPPQTSNLKLPSKLSRPADETVTGNTNGEQTEREARPYRERLQAKLGADYQGVERYRLDQDTRRERHWKRWGPYLSDRQWATVREDYSENGDAWAHFPHEHARSRTYRWGEDGIAGLSDNHLRLCLSMAFWNGQDRMLKERLFGVSGPQGNHGEDVKEVYYYLDSTPTHSYMKFLYKYPQKAFPYEELVRENQQRGREVQEFEILDTDVFDEDRYWDIFVEYAKDEDTPDNIYVRVTAYNRGPESATLHIIPQLFFQNTWSWPTPPPVRPRLQATTDNRITATHATLGRTHLYCFPSPPPVGSDGKPVTANEDESVEPELLFTENDTNYRRLWGVENKSAFVKDAFHDYIVPAHREQKLTAVNGANGSPNGSDDGASSDPPTPQPERQFVNPERKGTKAAAHYTFENVPGRGGCAVVRLKLTAGTPNKDPTLEDEGLFDDTMEERRVEADEFYHALSTGNTSDDLRAIMRQALGGMMWTKQYFKFITKEWIEGDPAQPPPPHSRRYHRNAREWKHLYAADILSMPDKWEYPYFAAWDSAFHCIPLAIVDPTFAKKQLDLLTREWYMKPDGQIPAYEWNFSDVNPPVHAWATFRVFKIERKLYGREDLQFLERVFQKLLINFTWWVNRKDQDGAGVFEGGFLGLDNIGVFNRSEPLPTGGVLRQADGTAWMAFYALNMLSMSLELAKHNPVYEDIASKFFEHFIFIADAMTFAQGENSVSLWNAEDGLYYDAIQWGSHTMQLPVRSLVGLIPLYATLVLEPQTVNRFPGFKKRMEWFIENRPESERNIANMRLRGRGERYLLALADHDRLVSILQKMLDENEFLSEHGIRSLSKAHKDRPWGMEVNGQRHEVNYWPGESHSGMFGGNSNWRGPIWLAVNFLLIESLQRFYQYYGDDLQVECPTGSGEYMNLIEVAEEIQHRIIHIFGRDVEGRRATNGGNEKLDFDPNFRDYVWFYEYFHGDDGRGLGASHQTGWTGLVAYHIAQSGVTCRLPKTPRTPRSLAHHYFDEALDSRSEYDDAKSLLSAYSVYDSHSQLGDVSPEAL
ncbi:Six-hairpin glycosidase-like protein [Vararia minispora EC-137]|uniref:Six-hairpin glycosidase-like protein n=1 Tax=Vararia minispora EC-137 TaxID=1314806 RepID=A0ACB8QFZ7_9AGAM|nr:Six-hairpin glycosidase-like protein [Vararia minispora EC-137]